MKSKYSTLLVSAMLTLSLTFGLTPMLAFAAADDDPLPVADNGATKATAVVDQSADNQAAEDAANQMDEEADLATNPETAGEDEQEAAAIAREGETVVQMVLTDEMDAQGAGWHWAATSKILTLSGFEMSAGNSYAFALHLPDGAVITLAKDTTNTITSSADGSFAIIGDGDLTINGAGILVASGKAGAIMAEGTLDIADITLEANAQTAAITADAVNVTGGVVTANASDATYSSAAILANKDITVVNNAQVTATAGKASNSSMALASTEGSISVLRNSQLTATAGEASELSAALYAPKGNVTVTESIAKLTNNNMSSAVIEGGKSIAVGSTEAPAKLTNAIDQSGNAIARATGTIDGNSIYAAEQGTIDISAEEEMFPWGWVIVGAVLLIALVVGIMWFMKNRDKEKQA